MLEIGAPNLCKPVYKPWHISTRSQVCLVLECKSVQHVPGVHLRKWNLFIGVLFNPLAAQVRVRVFNSNREFFLFRDKYLHSGQLQRPFRKVNFYTLAISLHFLEISVTILARHLGKSLGQLKG